MASLHCAEFHVRPGLVRGWQLLFTSLMLGGCFQLPARMELPDEHAGLPATDATRLDRTFAPFEAKHPGESAFRLVSDGLEAFVLRERSASMAERTLDVQTYIWHDDLTGLVLAHRLLEAADRGVRVRLLVDDMDARAKNVGFAALAAHPNISVRLFNPFVSRAGLFALVREGLTSFRRINHRMHNKSWIADNRIALVGGRNLGDEYFSANTDFNFVDLDFAMVGPVVRDASASFDRYWNSPAAYPIEQLDPRAVTGSALETARDRLSGWAARAATSRYADVLRTSEVVGKLVAGDWPMHWTPRYQFVADDPLKATLGKDDPGRSRVVAAVNPAVTAAMSRVAIVSPYFVPGQAGTAALVGVAARGVEVAVLTNSLAANDVAAVHGGYSRSRVALLQGGVGLWELKPSGAGEASSSLFGSSGASLHTKAVLVDDRIAFVGSYNLDPRSTFLNCEQGVLVDEPAIGARLREIIATQMQGQRSWRVTLAEERLLWSDGVRTAAADPDASGGRRFQAWASRVLGLDAQL